MSAGNFFRTCTGSTLNLPLGQELYHQFHPKIPAMLQCFHSLAVGKCQESHEVAFNIFRLLFLEDLSFLMLYKPLIDVISRKDD